MLRLKVVTYTQGLINKASIESFTLLTKDGKKMSILTGSEYVNVIEHVATYDESLKTFIIEEPVINATTEYDEAEMLEMFDGATIIYGDVSYDGNYLFEDEIWIREIMLRNDERYVSIERAIPRNFWHHAFIFSKRNNGLSGETLISVFTKLSKHISFMTWRLTPANMTLTICYA